LVSVWLQAEIGYMAVNAKNKAAAEIKISFFISQLQVVDISTVLLAGVEPVFEFIFTGSTPSIHHFDTEHLV
jgi:hypothetical protein